MSGNRIECDTGQCGWFVHVATDISDQQAAAIVVVLGGTASGNHHRCPRCAAKQSTTETPVATLIGATK